MKYLYKNILFAMLIILCSTITTRATAQKTTSMYNWQLGLGVGYTNYYGDLSNYRISKGSDIYKIYKFADYNQYYQHQPSFSLLLQKKVTPTMGIMLQANYLQFAMSDRYRKNNGSLDSTSTNFARSLNFRTTLQDIGIAFTFSPNNGRIGSEKAFFYPSFYLGAGLSKFEVKGDLYDAKNNSYEYTRSGNINDGSFETNLRDLRTETDSKYRNVEPYVDLGLALNFRISSMITIAIQSDIKYSASDYLDDVSTTYKSSYATPAEAYAAKPGYNDVDPLTKNRGDNNGMNDFYINNRIVLNIALRKKQTVKQFNPPVIYSLNTPYIPRKTMADTAKKITALVNDSLLAVKRDSARMVRQDSIMKVQFAISKSQVEDSSVRKQLESISAELKNIKSILHDQQMTPRLQHLQYQYDSVKNLRNRLATQRPIGNEGNLRLRIYDLQADSIKHEIETLQYRDRFSSGSYDTTLRSIPYYAYPTAAVNPVIKPGDTAVMATSYDSTLLRAGYQKKIDSIQKKLLLLERKGREPKANTVLPDNITASAMDTVTTYRSQPITNTAAGSIYVESQKRNADTLALLKSQLKESKDSVAYFRKLRNDTVMTSTADEHEKKSTWLQRTFSLGSKKQKRAPAPDTISKQNFATEEQYYETRVDSAAKKIDEIEKRKAVMPVEDSNVLPGNKSLPDSITYSKNRAEVQRQIKQNSDSIAMLQQQLKRSNDSGSYYKRLVFASGENTDSVSVKKSKKWYTDLFTSQKKMQKRKNAENKIIDNNNDNRQQEEYYDNEIKRMQQTILDLENRNRELLNSYQSMNTERNERQWNSTPPAPVIVYPRENSNPPNTANDDLDSLRAELEALKIQVNNVHNNPDSGRLPETIPQTSTMPTAVVEPDSSQVNSLRSELSQLRKQLDSLTTNHPPVTVEKVVSEKEKYDVKGFPVISVYFKMGSVVLSGDQLNKITPFIQVASKNKDAAIILKGYTDAVGNPAKNKVIAKKRSGYIRNLLVSKNVSEDRISIQEPSLSDVHETDKTANALDRRVDLQFD